MKKEIITAKGTRNFAPKEALRREEIIEKIKKIFRLYGFSPIEVPAIEKLDLLAGKYAGGQEITKEIFKLKDRGDRELGLRYDLTVPLAIFISQNLNFKFPFKRYHIASIWRDGPIKSGRYREFIQCDADTVGSESMLADVEILSLARDVFKELGMKVNILVNNRKFLNGLLQEFGVGEKKITKTILTLDKLGKLSEKEVKIELSNLVDKSIITKIFSVKEEKLNFFKKFKNRELQKGLEELKNVFDYAKVFDLKLEFSPFLARGLEYYTNTVFEVYTEGFSSSIAGGGRYNKMIGKFAGVELPAVGISFGLDTVYDAIIKKTKIDKQKLVRSPAKMYVIPISKKEEKEAIRLVMKLRERGINSEIAIDKKISRALDYADALAIPFVIFIGTDEVKKNKFKVKDMKTGKESLLKI